MEIIIDTREQLPLSFTGHETTRRKLDEGDYATEESIPNVVIERKSIEDFYGSIIQGHARFKREILRSAGKQFFIFLEGNKKDVFDYCKTRKFNPLTMAKIVDTMIQRYNIVIVECETRQQMSKKIETELKKW